MPYDSVFHNTVSDILTRTQAIAKYEAFIDANGKLCKRFVPETPDYSINIQAPKVFDPYTCFLSGIDTVAPDNAEIHISVSRRKNIKFNFKN